MTDPFCKTEESRLAALQAQLEAEGFSVSAVRSEYEALLLLGEYAGEVLPDGTYSDL